MNASCQLKEGMVMYELIILSLLMRGPIHGYLISKFINDIIGPVAKVSHGWLYPRLAKLQEEDLLQIVRIVTEHKTPDMYVKNDLEGYPPTPFSWIEVDRQRGSLVWICILLETRFCGFCGILQSREWRFNADF